MNSNEIENTIYAALSSDAMAEFLRNHGRVSRRDLADARKGRAAGRSSVLASLRATATGEPSGHDGATASARKAAALSVLEQWPQAVSQGGQRNYCV